jgi:hypothetical protein
LRCASLGVSFRIELCSTLTFRNRLKFDSEMSNAHQSSLGSTRSINRKTGFLRSSDIRDIRNVFFSGGNSSQGGAVLDAAAGDAVGDDAPALVGAVNVVTGADDEVEGVAVIAVKLTTPLGRKVVSATPAVIAAAGAVAGPANTVRSSVVSWAMALSNSVPNARRR